VPTIAPAGPEVLVTVKATPEHAAIYLGDERIGVAPGPVKLKRGSDKVNLTLKADGFTPGEVSVTPTNDTTVEVKLGKVAGKPSQPQRPKTGYENPF
jgi:hypothetical protein